MSGGYDLHPSTLDPSSSPLSLPSWKREPEAKQKSNPGQKRLQAVRLPALFREVPYV
jgi:hypothetical protein